MISIVLQEGGSAIGHRGPMVVAATEGPHSFGPERTRRAVDAIVRLRQTSHRDRLIYVYVASEDSNVPDAESRRIASEIAQHVDVMVGVHEGSGFRASAVRAVVTGISLLQPRRISPRVLSSVSDAGAYLQGAFPELGSAATIEEAIEDVRAAARATV